MTNANNSTSENTSRTYRNDPVFEVEYDFKHEYPNGDTLPSIWITEPLIDDDGVYQGRTYAMIYPYDEAVLPFTGHKDEDGNDALYYGGRYYDEAMSYTSSQDYEKRVDCFRAAELLYRHSAGRGNAVANLCLGYVYSYDRCSGRYWVNPMTHETEEDYKRPYPREERAFECYLEAAEADICEACYKLGDMYKHGMGCDQNAKEAFRWYVRASELAEHERPVILGSVALRLADCYEDGIGCTQDFERASEWYKKAVVGLEIAVENGEVWYEKALAGARAGKKRCLQELGQ
ncbi:MAG: sel1 repeat family protein [Atopobiaceae bacterium]|nr:sel1 repeat family protein [Atopobiaceae bacterium]